jgi:hypothetical protein
MVVRPGVWTRRRIAIPGILEFNLPSPSRRALLGAGFDSFRCAGSALLGRPPNDAPEHGISDRALLAGRVSP